jgi:hypothetical protein
MVLTKDAGVDVAIEAVSIPTTFNICQSIVVIEVFIVVGFRGRFYTKTAIKHF